MLMLRNAGSCSQWRRGRASPIRSVVITGSVTRPRPLVRDQRQPWASSPVVAAAASGGGGGGGGRGRGRGRGGRGRGRGGGKKKAPPPLDLATADVVAVALSVEHVAQEEEDDDNDDDDADAADADADTGPPRLPDALRAAMPDRFPTGSAARRAIRRGTVLVAADGADDGDFESVAAPEALQAKVRAFVVAEKEGGAAAPSPLSLILGNCGTRVLRPGVCIVALEPGADATSRNNSNERREASLRVVYEDEWGVMVVVKPWGIAMSGGDPARTVSGALARMAAKDDEKEKAASPPSLLPRPQAAHRLDAAVGGLVAVGKTASAVAEMSRAFRERRVGKRYRALLRGRLDPGAAVANGLAVVVVGDGVEMPAATSDEAIGLDEAFGSPVVGAGSGGSSSGSTDAPPPILSIRLALDGKECETHLAVAGYSRCPRYGGWITTADLVPVTGRQHQLRRHCAALGHAIVGDGRYRGEGERVEEAEEGEGGGAAAGGHIGGQGLFLESVALEFEQHPAAAVDQAAHPRLGPLLVQQDEPRRFVTLRQQQRSAWAKAERVKARAAAAAAAADDDDDGVAAAAAA